MWHVVTALVGCVIVTVVGTTSTGGSEHRLRNNLAEPSDGAPQTEVVYYLGDPQIGFSGNVTLDTIRFGLAAAAARADALTTATVVAGDLVNVWNSPVQIAG
jgi:hypothetical protein